MTVKIIGFTVANLCGCTLLCCEVNTGTENVRFALTCSQVVGWRWRLAGTLLALFACTDALEKNCLYEMQVKTRILVRIC